MSTSTRQVDLLRQIEEAAADIDVVEHSAYRIPLIQDAVRELRTLSSSDNALVNAADLQERTALYVALKGFLRELDTTPVPGLFKPMAEDLRDAANTMLARLVPEHNEHAQSGR